MNGRPALIAVDGANGRAIVDAADRIAPDGRPSIKGISRWDASGLFEQLLIGGAEGGAVSPRMLVLLYAADLAFRLRWEIEPALAEGHSVVAAPYIQTAVAFGRACGLSAKWLDGVFRFARRPSESRIVGDAVPASARADAGFVEFGCALISEPGGRFSRRELAARTRRHLPARTRLRARRADHRAR